MTLTTFRLSPGISAMLDAQRYLVPCGCTQCEPHQRRTDGMCFVCLSRFHFAPPPLWQMSEP